MSTVQIPPIPKPSDFIDKGGTLRRDAYKLALDAWQSVARAVIDADKSNHFWNR